MDEINEEEKPETQIYTMKTQLGHERTVGEKLGDPIFRVPSPPISRSSSYRITPPILRSVIYFEISESFSRVFPLNPAIIICPTSCSIVFDIY